MPTYNGSAVSDAVIAFRKPITLQQGRALRDNPLAVAEGAANAPYVATEWHPYDGALVGDGNTGEIWSLASDGIVASVETPDFEDGYEYRLRFEAVSSNSGITLELTVNLYRETSAAYAGVMNVSAAFAASAAVTGYAEIKRPRSETRLHFVTANTYDIGTNGVYAASDVLNPAVRHTTAQKILRAQVAWVSGSIDAGVIYMDRRRVYA